MHCLEKTRSEKMEEYQTRFQQVTNTFLGIVLRVLSLHALNPHYFGWAGFDPHINEIANHLTTYLGILIIFVCLFLKVTKNTKMKINLSGNAILWIPIVCRAFYFDIQYPWYNLSFGFYICMLNVIVCIVLETVLLKKYPKKS